MNRMKNMFTGAVALVTGMALSAGSALATNGYVGGDHARVKLVPYYETGDTRATIIGIQNTSPQEASTIDLDMDVTDVQTVLNGGVATTRAAGLITGFTAGWSLCSDTAACTAGQTQDPTRKANTEAALEKANMAAQTEHLFVMVNAYDDMGMKMGSATLCLAENQFGYVVLQGSESMMMDSMRGKTLSVMDDEISAYGYVMVMAEDRKFTGCGAVAPNTLKRVDNDTDSTTDIGPTDSKIAAWTIIQDIGDGFFGTEVPTSTLMTTAAMDDTSTANVNEAEQLDCYTAALNTVDPADTPARAGFFHMTACGLVPERHNNTRDNAGAITVATATPRATITVRYDIGDETMVYVWLAEGMDMETTLPKDSRKIEVAVKCEGGMMPMGPDMDGDNKPDPVMVAAPDMVTMIDPSMGAVGALTDMCGDEDRGVLEIKMPDKSYAGTAFTHITQMVGHYRMNFPGYSMAGATDCTTAAGTGATAEAIAALCK